MSQTTPINPKRRVVAINGNAGGFTTISASKNCRYVRIIELPAAGGYAGGAFTGQGLDYQLPDDGFTATFTLPPGNVFELGQKEGPNRRAVGQAGWTTPDNQAVPATVYGKFRSANVTATNVEVEEWS